MNELTGVMKKIMQPVGYFSYSTYSVIPVSFFFQMLRFVLFIYACENIMKMFNLYRNLNI